MTALTDRTRIADILAASSWHMACLEALATLGLPDAWIGAGFVRGAVWDRLHGFDRPTPLPDLDVVYFDPADPEGRGEPVIEARLEAMSPPAPYDPPPVWSARNQARMHVRNGDTPYQDTAEALTRWLETPTCVAARLGPGGVDVLAPLGTADLFGLRVRPTPHALSRPDKLAQYRERLDAKRWDLSWPRLRLERE
ncbi:MAG TPA: nucleotidyltransferase family protein [Azospirillaceae bacterium]|nr:nucleotidyltransferase family protein [Azospirillaceae bacterium]